jgi:lysyl-tRNA synthetase class 2
VVAHFLRDAVKNACGIDYVAIMETEELRRRAREAGADIPNDMVRARIIDELLKTFVRPSLIAPTFLTDYPVELSPLAKAKPGDPTIVERFQPFIAGMELGNAYTELNDPLDQLTRFEEQARQRAQGDAEAMPVDEDFITALMQGMPPTGGLGLGIDRMVMFSRTSRLSAMSFSFPRSVPPKGDDRTDGAQGLDAVSTQWHTTSADPARVGHD